MQPRPQSSIALPVAIIFGFSVVAATLAFNHTPAERSVSAIGISQHATPEELAISLHQPIRSVAADDIIRGNPNAPVLLVTYMGYTCDTCRNFYHTMNRLMQDMGNDGNVGWVFRHLPPENNQGTELQIANASLCARKLATESSNRAFWSFADSLFKNINLRDLGTDDLVGLALEHQLEQNAFTSCLNSQSNTDRIHTDQRDAIQSGAFVTPFTVIITPDEVGVLHGSQSYGTIRQIVEIGLN